MYFDNLQTVTEIKTVYRQLVWIYHPDRGGDTATMQAINAEYEEALKSCDGQTSTGTDGKKHTYHYNQDLEKAVMDKIDELLKLKLEGVNIWLVGTWLWIDGDTKPVKDRIKSVGCKWHGKRKKWYWRSGSYRRRPNPGTFGDLAAKYGLTSIQDDDKQRQAQPLGVA